MQTNYATMTETELAEFIEKNEYSRYFSELQILNLRFSQPIHDLFQKLALENCKAEEAFVDIADDFFILHSYLTLSIY